MDFPDSLRRSVVDIDTGTKYYLSVYNNPEFLSYIFVARTENKNASYAVSRLEMQNLNRDVESFITDIFVSLIKEIDPDFNNGIGSMTIDPKEETYYIYEIADDKIPIKKEPTVIVDDRVVNKTETFDDNPLILVAAPTSVEKDYALQHYLDAYRNRTYKNTKLVLVDNSSALHYSKYLSRQKDVDYVLYRTPGDNLMDTIDACWDMILGLAERINVRYIMSIESDVITPPDTISYSLDLLRDKSVSMVVHHVKERGSNRTLGDVLACNLIDSYMLYGDDEWGDSDNHFEAKVYLRADHVGKGTHICTELGRYMLHMQYPEEYRNMAINKWGRDCGIVL